MKHTMGFTITLSAILLASLAGAQTQSQSNSQDQSLADYARKARKDTGTTGAAKSKKVFDNDNIPREDKLSVVGTAPPPDSMADNNAGEPKPADSSANAAANAGAAAPATESKPGAPEDDPAKKQAEWKQWQEKIGQQKDQIDLLARELDVLQREYQLRAAAMYADVGNRLRNSANWDKEDSQYKQKIADKQKQVDDAKQKLDDLQEQARRAGVPSAMRE